MFTHPVQAQTDRGAVIYQDRCARCHGIDGQGEAEAFDKPLLGDYTVVELAQLISKTMPEDKPEECVGDDARQVAQYIHDEFYSLEARQRKGLIAKPRVELARLTVPQYRNAVADLIGTFTPTAPPERRVEGGRRGGRGGRGRRAEEQPASPIAVQPGLKAEYYQSKGMSKADQLQQRQVDRRIDFDFQDQSPAEGITADQFAIIWEGSLVPDETGYFEFRVRTQNGARLYLNYDPAESLRKLRDDSAVAGQMALIDAWVGSGNLREASARVFLLGGRRYPLRVEFFKYMEKTASIKVEWKPPRESWSVLDHNHLSTESARRVFVSDAPFPADDRSLGYERGSSVSVEWHAATTAGAVAAATEIVNRLPLLSGVDEDSPERLERLQEFVLLLASAAFRRPLISDEEEMLRKVPFADAPTPEAGVRRAVVLILKSPHFLYTDLTPADQPATPHAVASRLAFALWDSIPDQPLLDAANSGQLATSQQIEAQARRMLDDPRAKAKMRDFFRHWLEIEEREVAKDREMFPEFDEAVIADLRHSLELFLDQVMWSEQSDYRQLLLADYLVLNDRLRSLYQSELAEEPEATAAVEEDGPDEGSDDPVVQADERPEGDFERVTFPDRQRAGVLTHPYLLSAFSYHNNTSPIHRGVFVTRNIVGRSLKPPPIAVAFKNDEFAPDLTMREKITQLTRDRACMSCHSVINPLGFALENYDPIGRWRTQDNQKPVDTLSQYTAADGTTVEVRSARDIADFAVANQAAHRAFIHQLFHHLVKQNPAAYGADVSERLRQQFADDDFNVQRLMVRIAAIASTHGQTAAAATDVQPSIAQPTETPQTESQPAVAQPEPEDES